MPELGGRLLGSVSGAADLVHPICLAGRSDPVVKALSRGFANAAAEGAIDDPENLTKETECIEEII